jgi:hypothetical protein
MNLLLPAAAASAARRSSRPAGPVRAALILAGALPLLWAAPFIAMVAHSILPRLVANYLFFLPQLAFPYDRLVVWDSHRSRGIIADDWDLVLNLAHWLALGAFFVWLTRRLRASRVVVLALALVLLSGFVVPGPFALFGITVALDGP